MLKSLIVYKATFLFYNMAEAKKCLKHGVENLDGLSLYGGQVLLINYSIYFPDICNKTPALYLYNNINWYNPNVFPLQTLVCNRYRMTHLWILITL
jgi:hypothetical protein